MQPFEYARPRSTKEVVGLLSQYGSEAALLAGGTDLISLMKDGIVAPSVVVSLQSVQDLRGIRIGETEIRIGAGVTLEELRTNSDLGKRFPAVLQAIEGITSPQIRSVGTVGGDLCQRPRCWYYRNGFGLLASPNGQSMVREGDNRYHAILGNEGEALFVNPSSLAPALVALGATVSIEGSKGARQVPLNQFYTSPTAEGEKEYSLGDDEVVTAVVIPAGNLRSATYEVREREVLDWPLVTASVALEMNSGRVSKAAVVLGHVAPKPWVAESAAQFLVGQEINQETAEKSGEMAVSGARPLSHNAYKVRLARVAVKRALMRAAGMEV